MASIAILAPPARAGAAAGPQPRLSTPLLSVRRVPAWVEGSVAGARLAGALDRVWGRLGQAVADHSCLEVTRGDRVLYSVHPALPVLPASNMKLLTATAALEQMGTATRLSTGVAAPTAPVGGTVGSLYLVGGGDPDLYTASYDRGLDPPRPLYTSLATLAQEVRAAGVRRVTGSVVGDATFLEGVHTPPGWKALYETEGDVGPLSALEVDDGFVQRPPYGPAPDPAQDGAALFTRLLRAAGVAVGAAPTSGVTPAGAQPVARIASAPLGAVVGQILRVSDDTGAELVLELLGRHALGVGSSAAGLVAERRQLRADGLPVGQVRAFDGSGLSRLDRVTCGFLDLLLRHDGTTGPVFAGLPVAGRTGTLADRMAGTPAAGRVHAKTGTLVDVASLSGFVLPKKGVAGAPLVFSVVLNDLPDVWDYGIDAGNAIAEALAAYPQVPPVSAAGPVGG